MRWMLACVTAALLCACAPVPAPADGIARIDRLDTAQADVAALPPRALAALPVANDPAQVDVRDRLQSARQGGWWRIVPNSHTGARVLAIYHPYSARIVLRAPPDYAPRQASVFEHQALPLYSRRALVFALPATGDIYLGLTEARYPLRVGVEPADAYAASDRTHTQIFFTTIGVLVGVCLIAILFWIALRDRVYLLYAATMASQMLYLLCSYGEAYAMPVSWRLGAFGAPGIWFIATLSTIAAAYFLLDIAELRTRVPRFSRALAWVGGWLPALLLVGLVLPLPGGKEWFPPVGNLLLLAANVIAIACLLLAAWGGGRHALLTLLAWLPLVTASTLRAMQLTAGAPIPPWLEYGLPLTLAFAAVLLMLGLADRMRVFRSERDRAQTHAERDPLTGVYNRSGIERRLTWALQQTQQTRQPLSVLFLDIDHFKPINDTHGHAVGDVCLAAVVRSAARELQFGDHLGRLGGEEFLIVLPGSDARRARDTAEAIRRAVQLRCRTIAGVPMALTVSIGVAESVGTEEGQPLIARADAAMYAAKRRGRNRVALHADA